MTGISPGWSNPTDTPPSQTAASARSSRRWTSQTSDSAGRHTDTCPSSARSRYFWPRVRISPKDSLSKGARSSTRRRHTPRSSESTCPTPTAKPLKASSEADASKLRDAPTVRQIIKTVDNHKYICYNFLYNCILCIFSGRLRAETVRYRPAPAVLVRLTLRQPRPSKTERSISHAFIRKPV